MASISNNPSVNIPSTNIPIAKVVGIIGFGAFGRLVAEHLRPHFRLRTFDPACSAETARAFGAEMTSFDDVARCPIVVLAVPVSGLRDVVASLALLLVPGALVLDVGSVKVEPALIMQQLLPDNVSIVATHPLFGPQSARHGIRGLSIAVCPLRGARFRAAAFFRSLGLRVIMTTPEEHDREAAQVQGITHAIAKLVIDMDLPRTRITTRSYELLMAAVEMVRYDSTGVSEAILNRNPYAEKMLATFASFAVALTARSAQP